MTMAGTLMRRRRQKLCPLLVAATTSELVVSGGMTPRTCSGVSVDLDELTINLTWTIARDVGVQCDAPTSSSRVAADLVPLQALGVPVVVVGAGLSIGVAPTSTLASLT